MMPYEINSDYKDNPKRWDSNFPRYDMDYSFVAEDKETYYLRFEGNASLNSIFNLIGTLSTRLQVL
jgi:hypothetical protein